MEAGEKGKCSVGVTVARRLNFYLKRLNMEWCKKWILIYKDGSQEIIYANNFFELSQKVKDKPFIKIVPMYD